MSVLVERLSDLKRKVTVTIPDQDIEQDVVKQLQELTAKVKIKGFRPGKVPLIEVKRRYGKSVREDVINKLVGTKLDEIVREQDLKPAGAAHIEKKADAPDELVQYEATFEVYPEIQLASLKGSKIERVSTKITAADVDKMLDKMRRQHASGKRLLVLRKRVISSLSTLLVSLRAKNLKVGLLKVLI